MGASLCRLRFGFSLGFLRTRLQAFDLRFPHTQVREERTMNGRLVCEWMHGRRFGHAVASRVRILNRGRRRQRQRCEGPSERTSKRARRRKDWDGGKEGDWGVGSWVLSVGDAHVPPPEASRWSPWHPPIGSLGSRFRPRRRRNPP